MRDLSNSENERRKNTSPLVDIEVDCMALERNKRAKIISQQFEKKF